MPLPYRRGAERIIRYLTGRYRLGGVLPNDGYIVGVPKNLVSRADLVSSTGTGPDVLHSYTLPAGSLKTAGDYLDIWYAGGFGVNDRDKAVQTQIDNVDYSAPAAHDIDSDLGWLYVVRIIRVDPTHVSIALSESETGFLVDSADVVTGSAGSLFAVRHLNSFAISDMDNNNIVLRVRSVVAAGAAVGDVYQHQSIINLVRIN